MLLMFSPTLFDHYARNDTFVLSIINKNVT